MSKNPNRDPAYAREAKKYESPIASREFILETLKKINKPQSFSQLQKRLQIVKESEIEALRRRLLAMVRDGQLETIGGNYRILEESAYLRGYVQGHRDGFGFVVLEEGGDDVYLSPREMRRVFHQDTVLIRLVGVDRRGRPEGAVVKVLSHNTQQLAGRLRLDHGVFYVEPDDAHHAQVIYVAKSDLHHATPGQIVVVELIEQPTRIKPATGRIIEVLGDEMAPGMEVELAIRSHGLPHVFSDEVIAEAEYFGDEVQEWAGRRDLRELPFVTIDGEDAKDFDDAVYCEALEKGQFRLYVAIADVSHYVKPDSALDKEAYLRGNSVYFPGEVIPMLPYCLSNGLCSLNALVNRLVVVCEMTITAEGEITHFDFYDAIIRSAARMTYTNVFAILQKDAAVSAAYQKLLPQFYALYECYQVLWQARKVRGAIEFESTETKILFSETRKIEKIVPVVRNDAHRLIEECMLCANVCAAQFLIQHKVDGLYRVHFGPNAEKLTDLKKSLNELGIIVHFSEEPTPGEYAHLLESIAARPDAHLINTLLLRSLSQAIYSPEEAGHFGLAYDHYTHFTSPIRRYPDLLVHRLIKSVISKRQLKISGLLALGEHCSMTERRADEATREAVAWLKCEYMQDRVGETFSGIISGVTNFGFFVTLNDVYVEGLVHVTTLSQDFYQFDGTRHRLVGERTGQVFQLGMTVSVLVARVSLDDRQIDFVLADAGRS